MLEFQQELEKENTDLKDENVDLKATVKLFESGTPANLNIDIGMINGNPSRYSDFLEEGNSNDYINSYGNEDSSGGKIDAIDNQNNFEN